jgi:hypothetical protein
VHCLDWSAAVGRFSPCLLWSTVWVCPCPGAIPSSLIVVGAASAVAVIPSFAAA